MPQPNLESELQEPQIEELDAKILAGAGYQELQDFCRAQGYPARSLSSWSGYKRRAQSRAVQRAIFSGNALRAQLQELAKASPDEGLKSLLELQANIAMQLAVNGTADPAQLTLAHKLTKLLQESQAARQRVEIEERKLQQRQEQINLDRDKFEFDAATAALAKLPELHAVSAKKLTEQEKAEAVRKILFNQ